MFVSVFREQQHFSYLCNNGTICDAWYDGPTNSWNLQQINGGGLTSGPPAAIPFVSVFRDQQHFAYADWGGTIWDAWYDGPTNSWNLQQINAGGLTNGPPAYSLFVSVFRDQQHFEYKGTQGDGSIVIIWDSWYDGPTSSWNLQQINAGGQTNGPSAMVNCVFVSVFGDQQHFAYQGSYGVFWDAWYDGPTNSWNLQQINAGGRTNGPEGEQVFVSVFGDQQHFAYTHGPVWDAWYDGPTNSWNLQQINEGGQTNGPPATSINIPPFVSVFGGQQHFAYLDDNGIIWDAWYQN